jgi:hypothetical protein
MSNGFKSKPMVCITIIFHTKALKMLACKTIRVNRLSIIIGARFDFFIINFKILTTYSLLSALQKQSHIKNFPTDAIKKKTATAKLIT